MERTHSMLWLHDGAIFEYDRDKCSVTDWFPLGVKGRKTNLIYDNVERWPEVDHLRYPQQVDNMKLHISACCSVIQRHGPIFSGKSDPRPTTRDTVNRQYSLGQWPWRKKVPVLCDMTTPTYARHHVPKPTTQSVSWKTRQSFALVYTMSKSWFMDHRTENGACVWTVVNSMASMPCIPLYIPRAFRDQLCYYFAYKNK